MAIFTTKINLNDNKTYQLTGDTLNLSGSTFIGKAQYIKDDSVNYNNRSFIDKGYLDSRLLNFTGNTSVFVSGTTNGLTLFNKNIKLGGNLVNNTDIDINNKIFRLGQLSTFGPYFYANPTLFEISNYINTNNNSKILLYQSGTTEPLIKLISTASGITAGYIIDQNGLKALDNYYSDNVNNPRWIPDKAYVDTKGNNTSNNYNITIITGNTTLNTGSTFVILVNKPNLSTLVILPLSPINGMPFKIKDIGGNALVNNITVNGNGKNIDGFSTATINTNYGGIEIVYSSISNSWSILSFIN